MQVALALAAAEQHCEFEHRDLHISNVLLSDTEETTVRYRVDGQELHCSTGSERCRRVVTIIDFTWSRCRTADGAVIYKDMGLDDEIFEGDTSVQHNVYRDMRDVIGDSGWAATRPITNAMWLSYLLGKLMNAAGKSYSNGMSEMRAALVNLNSMLNEEGGTSAVGIVAADWFQQLRQRQLSD